LPVAPAVAGNSSEICASVVFDALAALIEGSLHVHDLLGLAQNDLFLVELVEVLIHQLAVGLKLFSEFFLALRKLFFNFIFIFFVKSTERRTVSELLDGAQQLVYLLVEKLLQHLLVLIKSFLGNFFGLG
jgi:hypothetical protein